MKAVFKSSLAAFLSERPFSVVHIDAPWDGDRKVVEQKLAAIESEFEREVSFGYADSDQEQAYANEIGIVNVPSVAYYKGNALWAVVIGIKQDIAENIRQLIRGDTLDTTNKLSRS